MRDIPDIVMLKLVYKTIANHQPNKGYRVKTRNGEERVTFDELSQFLKQLIQSSDNGTYRRVSLCETCGNFSRTPKTKRGWCSNLNNSNRCINDFCSHWKPMDDKQQHVRERMYELESSQTK